VTPEKPAEQTEAEVSSNPVERCEIVQWRGYLTSAFYARRVDGVPVTESSRSFRHRGSASPPDEPSMQLALADVVDALEQEGWLAVGRGAEWFSKRFERLAPRTAPVALPVEPETPIETELPPPLPEYVLQPVSSKPPKIERKDQADRRWQIAALVALPGALALLGWLVAGG
jgi:hypothetical protein